MSMKNPILLPKSPNLLKYLAEENYSLVQNNSLQLVVWTVSGESCLQRDKPKNLPSLSLSLGDREQSLTMNQVEKGFVAGVLGKKYNRIAGYRSAISAFHNPIDGCKVGDHARVSSVVQGIFNLKPPKPRYPFIWDVDQFLNYLNNLAVGSNLLRS